MVGIQQALTQHKQMGSGNPKKRGQKTATQIPYFYGKSNQYTSPLCGVCCSLHSCSEKVCV